MKKQHSYKPMNKWAYRAIVGTAITVIISGAGTGIIGWVTKVNAQDVRITKIEVLLPEIRDDVKEIKQDVKQIQRHR